MSWQNAFDAGPCIVEARHVSTAGWIGLLAKGESSPTFPGYIDGETMQVVVDSSGVAMLMRDDAVNLSDGWTLVVIPQFDIDGASARARAIQINSDATDTAKASTAIQTINLTPPSGWEAWVPTTVTPDPAAFDPATSSESLGEIAVYMGARL